MSYKCAVCYLAVGWGNPLKKHITYRSNGQIERELPVCNSCNSRLNVNPNLRQVRQDIENEQALKDGALLEVADVPLKNLFDGVVVKPITTTNGSNGHPVLEATLLPIPTPPMRCDVCKKHVKEGTGQVTADTILCEACAQKAAKRAKDISTANAANAMLRRRIKPKE